jgi:uncharacterized membrane protein YadS
LFVAMVAVNSSGALSPALQQAAGSGERGGRVVGFGARGLNNALAQLASAGGRPVVLMGGETQWLAAVVVGGIALRER